VVVVGVVWGLLVAGASVLVVCASVAVVVASLVASVEVEKQALLKFWQKPANVLATASGQNTQSRLIEQCQCPKRFVPV